MQEVKNEKIVINTICAGMMLICIVGMFGCASNQGAETSMRASEMIHSAAQQRESGAQETAQHKDRLSDAAKDAPNVITVCTTEEPVLLKKKEPVQYTDDWSELNQICLLCRPILE